MSITQRRSLDSNAIKLIAILAMTVDHIAWAVFPGYPRAALPLLMHLIGRITCTYKTPRSLAKAHCVLNSFSLLVQSFDLDCVLFPL